MDATELPLWIKELSEEDLHLVKRFILCSGSLKDLAAEYGISYPTMRVRLDRLIEKVRICESEESPSAFRRKLQLMIADGALDQEAARAILREHERCMKGDNENG